MVIEPFNYQKRTNIEEHNQIVDKLNEVVDAVNNIDPNPSEFEQRIDALELSAINQQNAIEGIHTRDALQDTAIKRAEDNVSQLERNVLGVNETVSGLTGQVTQLETDTTNLDGRVTDLNGRLTTLANNQTALEGRVDSINTEVGQLSTEVGGLQTGKVNVAQGAENNGKYLGVGEDGNVTLKEIVIPGGKTYKMKVDRGTYSDTPTTPTTVTVNGIEYKRYRGALNMSNLYAYTDVDIAKIVFNDTDAYCGSLYFQKDTSYGPDPDYKTMGDAGIIYDVTPYGSNMWYTIMVPSDLYETINLTKIYITSNYISLEVA